MHTAAEYPNFINTILHVHLQLKQTLAVTRTINDIFLGSKYMTAYYSLPSTLHAVHKVFSYTHVMTASEYVFNELILMNIWYKGWKVLIDYIQAMFEDKKFCDNLCRSQESVLDIVSSWKTIAT